jgi:hypothetical protein
LWGLQKESERERERERERLPVKHPQDGTFFPTDLCITIVLGTLYSQIFYT